MRRHDDALFALRGGGGGGGGGFFASLSLSLSLSRARGRARLLQTKHEREFEVELTNFFCFRVSISMFPPSGASVVLLQRKRERKRETTHERLQQKTAPHERIAFRETAVVFSILSRWFGR